MTRLVAAASMLLVLCLVAFWWARAGGARAVTPQERRPDAEAPPTREPDAAPEPNERRLLVTVRDAGTGAPLPGSTVVATRGDGPPVEVVTDEAGEARLAPVDGKVLAQHRGYAAECEPVGIGRSELILLLKPGMAVNGRVIRAGSRKGIEGVSVTVKLVDSSDTEVQLTTDQEGRFEVPGLPPDAPFLVLAEHPGMGPAGLLVRRPEPDREIVLEMAGGATIEGRVIRPDGSMAADASVEVRPRGGGPLLPDELPFWVGDYEAETRTDAQGAFRIEGLRVPAAYEITAQDDRMSRGRGDVVEFREDGQSAWREIRLAARTTVHVRFEVPPGEPWPNPGASLRRGGKSEGTAWGRVDPDGAEWDVVALGAYEVWVASSNWPETHFPIEVREGRNEFVLPLTREGHRVISGRVVDERGIPLGGFPIGVTFTAADARLRTSPEVDGTFHLCDVPDIAGTLEVSDMAGIHAPWSRPDVAPGTDVAVVLRVAARFVGRVDPVPASRRITVRRLSRAHWPVGTQNYEIGGWMLSTDAQGRFEIPWSPGRAIALAFDPSDAAPIFREERPLEEGEVRDLGVLRLEPGRTAEGVVLDDAGNPVEDCRVSLEICFRGSSGGGIRLDDRILYTGPDGRFRFEHLPDAHLEVTLGADGFIERMIKVPTPVDLHGMEIRLVRAGTVEGVLVDAERRPVAGEYVECVTAQGDVPFYGTTDSLGRFRVAVAPGKYRLRSGDHEGPVVDARARETTRVEFPFKE